MQAVLERTDIKVKETQSVIAKLQGLLSELEAADNKTKNIIENKMVSLGETAIPELIAELQHIKGSVRGTIAMVLIRMGERSVKPLLQAASNNIEFDWMAKYLINEINCSNKIAA